MLSLTKPTTQLIKKSLTSTSTKSFISTSPQATSSKGSNNEEPRHSYTPYWLAGVAVLVVGGYYSISNKDPPQSGAVSSIERAMAPKTEGANVEGEDPSTGYTKRH